VACSSEAAIAPRCRHGVTVFPMGPGTVRTAMSEHSLNSPEGRKWLPWFKRIFDEGLDLPPERPAELVVRLASGRYDALSGLTLNPRDDLDEILARLEEVERDSSILCAFAPCPTRMQRGSSRRASPDPPLVAKRPAPARQR